MLLHRRIYQFFIIYLLAVAVLFLIKYGLNLSDYVIPGPVDVWHTGIREFRRYFSDVMNTDHVFVRDRSSNKSLFYEAVDKKLV